MEEILTRIWTELFGRIEGPMHFRCYMQPIVATVLALRSGCKDAKEGRPPFSIFFNRQYREYFRSHGWTDIRRLFFLAAILDIIYQVAVIKRIRPLETLFIACTLSIIPYMLVRPNVNRLLRWRASKKDESSTPPAETGDGVD